jgi:hypothetical protein
VDNHNLGGLEPHRLTRVMQPITGRSVMPKLIVPVGLDLGPAYAGEGPPDRLPVRYEVHQGATSMELNATEYAVWRAAFEQPDAHYDMKHDRQCLAAFVREHGHAPAGPVPDPDPVVDRLLELGLLAEFEPDGPGLERFFGMHRLYPRAEGVGTDPERSESHLIGDEEKVFCAVPPNVFLAWMDSVTAPSLWDVCAEVASDDNPDPGEAPLHLTATEIAEQVASSLPWMISTGAAWLDLVNYELPRIEAPLSFPPPRERLVGAGSDPVIIPIGLSLGPCYHGVPEDERHDRNWAVHFGVDYVELNADEAKAWTGASFDTERGARLEITRSVLEEFLREEKEVRMPGPVVDSLLKRGLLVELDPESAGLEELFSRVQLYPLRDGLGNSVDQPDAYRIGRGAEMFVGIPWEQYALWSHSMTCRSLWDACVEFANGANDDLRAGEQAWTPEWLATGVALVLPALLTSGTAYLDPLNYAF